MDQEFPFSRPSTIDQFIERVLHKSQFSPWTVCDQSPRSERKQPKQHQRPIPNPPKHRLAPRLKRIFKRDCPRERSLPDLDIRDAFSSNATYSAFSTVAPKEGRSNLLGALLGLEPHRVADGTVPSACWAEDESGAAWEVGKESRVCKVEADGCGDRERAGMVGSGGPVRSGDAFWVRDFDVDVRCGVGRMGKRE